MTGRGEGSINAVGEDEIQPGGCVGDCDWVEGKEDEIEAEQCSHTGHGRIDSLAGVRGGGRGGITGRGHSVRCFRPILR